MGVDETLLNEVVRRVLTVARPDRIILFGSAATGQMTEDSDLDLLVVEPEPANTRDRSIRIRRALGDVHYPVDVIVMSSERFREIVAFHCQQAVEKFLKALLVRRQIEFPKTHDISSKPQFRSLSEIESALRRINRLRGVFVHRMSISCGF
jgi:predicted nucleotidyltransferase